MQCSFILWHRQPTSKWISSSFISSLRIFADDPRLPPFFFFFLFTRYSQNNEPKQVPRLLRAWVIHPDTVQLQLHFSAFLFFLIWDELNAASRIQSEGGSRLRHIKSSANRTKHAKCSSWAKRNFCGPSGICPDAPMIGGNEKTHTILCMKIAFLFFILLRFTIGNNRPRQVCW
jgi:hypothetical protein